MKRILLMLLLVGVPLFTGCQEKGLPVKKEATRPVACDEMSSRLVARAYVLSNPIIGNGNDLTSLVQSNRGYFIQGGGVIQCMQLLGTALVQGGLARAKEYGGYSATERFGAMMPEGLAHLPGQVDDSMRSYGSDMLIMGQELFWLAQVLPPAAQGNYTPYNTTGTANRQMAAQVLPIYQMLCQMDPSICQMMQGMYREITPAIEQQIYTLARQLGN